MPSSGSAARSGRPFRSGPLRTRRERGGVWGVVGGGVVMASNWRLGRGGAAMAHVAAGVPELTYACDTHYPWQTDEVIAGGKLRIEDGSVAIPAGPGLGVALDRDALARLNEQYRKAGLVVRDDGAEMRKIDPTWTRHVGDCGARGPPGQAPNGPPSRRPNPG